MKDYSIDSNDRNSYILSYKIENEKIVAKLANGEFYIVPDNKENEQAVISKMEIQALNAKVKPIETIEKILLILLPLSLPSAILNFIDYGGWFFGISLVIIIQVAIVYPAKHIINAAKKRDIKKLNYFLDNQQELNDNIEKNENVLQNVSKKAVDQIKSEQNQGKKPLNINNIDNYSLKDLKILKKNIEKISSSCLKEDESMPESFSTEMQGPILEKKLGSKKK